MTPDSALEIVAAFMAVVLALALASVLLRPLWLPIWHLFKGTQEFLDDWNGEPARPGVAARPGAMARLAQLEKNSGSTMVDKVDELVVKVDRIGVSQAALLVEVDKASASAQHATVAAAAAAGEAQAGRAIVAESAAAGRRQIDELRATVTGVVNAVAEGESERRIKEEAYVAALNKIGVPLLPIADELEGGHL